MRTTITSILLLLLITSCSNEDIENTSSDNGEIKINVGVRSTTRSTGPIDSDFDFDFPIGIYATKDTTWLAGTSANWINNDSAIVFGDSEHAVSFGSGPYYYPADGVTLHFYAFAPYSTDTLAAGEDISPKVTHTITGQEDVMWASATGYKQGSNSAVHPSLNFQHKLAQLQFTLKSGTGYPTSGYKVVSLKVKSQPTTVEMTIETGTCIFSGSADMEALSVPNQTAGIEITSAGNNALSPVMTGTSTNYSVDIVVKPPVGNNITYSDVPITLNSSVGSSHMITITFDGTEVSATATVADWSSGSGGSGTAS